MTILRLSAAVLLSALLGACAYFSTTPDADLVSRVHRAVPIGMDIDEAAAALAGLDFSCGSVRHGAYTDENGRNHEDSRFMQCTKRPGTVSFACENRDQVVLVPGTTGKLTAVEVTRGPDCQSK